MTLAQDRFGELEARILQTIDLVRTTRQEKQIAEKELAAARTHIARLEEEIEQFKREREMVKAKVESLLEHLSELTEESLV
jgi:chromosome segregation ATPase